MNKMDNKKYYHIDSIIMSIYCILVIIGITNIYAVDYQQYIQDKSLTSTYAFKQCLWFFFSLTLFFIIFFVDKYFFEYFAYILYFISLLLLIGTLFFSPSVGGHTSWYKIGDIKIQPTEFSKLTCALVISKYLSKKNTCLTYWKCQLYSILLIALPTVLILLQGDIGSALVFSTFFIVLYQYNFPQVTIFFLCSCCILLLLTLWIKKWILILSVIVCLIGIILINKKKYYNIRTLVISIGINLWIISTEWMLSYMLKPYHKNRLRALINPNLEPLGIGWNITQAKIAIGSGGLYGKGFLQGTQTKFNFVPEQRTDFIFCTIGEEYGWLGTTTVILLYLILLLRILYVTEKQRCNFSKVYGYCLAAIIFFHVSINIGMTIGLMPIIGIPLPFMSYGGSALSTFSLMIFIFLKFDMKNQKHIY